MSTPGGHRGARRTPHWLGRADFRRAALWVSDDGSELIGVHWTAAFYFADDAAASRSEIAVLRIAASLAGQQPNQSLGLLPTGLDQPNIDIVLHAIAPRRLA